MSCIHELRTVDCAIDVVSYNIGDRVPCVLIESIGYNLRQCLMMSSCFVIIDTNVRTFALNIIRDHVNQSRG